MSPAGRDERDETFCQAYVVLWNGSAAARTAGVPEANARFWACRAMKRPEIRQRIEQLKTELRSELHVDAKELTRRWMQIATVDANELMEFRRCCCRHCWGKGFAYQRTDGEFKAARARHAKDLAKAQREGLDLVEEVPLEFDQLGGPGFVAVRDPNAECPECNGDGVGAVHFKDTRDLPEAARAAYAGVKITKDGIELKMHDPMKAAELLGRNLGMFSDKIDLNVTVKALAARMRNRAPLA